MSDQPRDMRKLEFLLVRQAVDGACANQIPFMDGFLDEVVAWTDGGGRGLLQGPNTPSELGGSTLPFRLPAHSFSHSNCGLKTPRLMRPGPGYSTMV